MRLGRDVDNGVTARIVAVDDNKAKCFNAERMAPVLPPYRDALDQDRFGGIDDDRARLLVNVSTRRRSPISSRNIKSTMNLASAYLSSDNAPPLACAKVFS